MRIASVAKAFSGAVALRLVARGKLELGDRIGALLPGLPRRVVGGDGSRQLLNHTSGLPDYTQSDGFRQQFEDDPQGYVSPAKIIGWVAGDPLELRRPAATYRYSNTDNIVVGLMAERVTGRSYGRLLREIVFEPLGLTRTSFPRDPPLPDPFIHGYVVEPRGAAAGREHLPQPVGRVGLRRDRVDAARARHVHPRLPRRAGSSPPRLQRKQLRFVAGGESSPPGPGSQLGRPRRLPLPDQVRDRLRPHRQLPGLRPVRGRVTRDGSRAVTTSLNIPAPSGELLAQLRSMQATAVCLLLAWALARKRRGVSPRR